MTIMPQPMVDDKAGLGGQLQALQGLVDSAVRTGRAAHEVEQELFRGVLQLGHALMGYFFRQSGDGDQGKWLEWSDGRVLKRFASPHDRSYQSVFGDFTVSRWVYGSREGQRIDCVPLDTRLQLPESSCSYLLQDWTQALVVEMAYEQAQAVLERVLGVSVPVSLMERLNRALGEAVPDYWEATPAELAEAADFVVVTADGKGVPMRKPAAAEPIRTHDSHRGPKPDRKKMAVVGAVYASDAYPRAPEQVWQGLFGLTVPSAANDDELIARPRPVAKAVRAALTHTDADGHEINARDEIFDWLGVQIRQRDPAANQPLVVIMDGQTCLWDEAARRFDDRPRIEILDLLHVTSKLWELVHLFHPAGSAHELDAMKLFTLMILKGQVELVIRWFGDWADERQLAPAARERVERLCGYFDNHKTRMHYDQYLAAGYPIASGVIEGACRHVVKDRLERAGMRWTVPGARAMLNLRCAVINGQWDEFNRFRIQRETERLYPYAEQFEAVEWPVAEAA